MKILLVEDCVDANAPSCVGRVLEASAHAVTRVGNGARAFELFRDQRPDVVITDVYVSGMDGFALTQAIQTLVAPRWQPVVFLSDHRDDDLQVRALLAGADVYIVKPVTAELLEAKLVVLQRQLLQQDQAELRARELEHYYRVEEEEKRMARHLIEHMVSAELLADPAVSRWICPSAGIGGDVVAAARTPAGVLHVLLADGTGHGLAASINVLPVFSPFYRMTEKGFGIDTIAREINAKVQAFVPRDRFVAATLASIDFREGVITLWNGGNPEAVLLGPDGVGVRTFENSHVPLGVLDDNDFDASLDVHAFVDGSQLVIYSDGLIKARNAAGEPYGIERFALVMVSAAAGVRLEAVTDAVLAHIDGTATHDDISLLLVDCQRLPEAVETELRPLPLVIPVEGNWSAVFRLSAREVRRVDVVPLLLGLAQQFECTRPSIDRLFVVLSELFNNAVDHGLLRLDSHLKRGLDGMERYLTERQKRLNEVSEGEIQITLEQLGEAGTGWLRIVCRDSGPGFDHGNLIAPGAMDSIGLPGAFNEMPNEMPSEMPFGRGLMLLRSMCAEVEFNAEGNEVTVIVFLTAGDSEK